MRTAAGSGAGPSTSRPAKLRAWRTTLLANRRASASFMPPAPIKSSSLGRFLGPLSPESGNIAHAPYESCTNCNPSDPAVLISVAWKGQGLHRTSRTDQLVAWLGALRKVAGGSTISAWGYEELKRTESLNPLCYLALCYFVLNDQVFGVSRLLAPSFTPVVTFTVYQVSRLRLG